MLENIKGYIKEKGIYIIFLLLILYIFFMFGYDFDFKEDPLTEWILNIIYFFIIYIFYFSSLLDVLNYKKLLVKGSILPKILVLKLNIIVFEIIQFYLLVNFWDKYALSKSLVTILMMLIPYIMMLLVYLLIYGGEEDEGKKKEIVLSFIITIIVCVLFPYVENMILIITIYNLIYILLGKELVKLKGTKLLLLSSIFVISLFYLGFLSTKNGIEVIRKEDDNLGINWYEQTGLGCGSGICFTTVGKIFFRKKVCGKAVDGIEEGKWIFWYNTGEKEGEGVYRAGKKEGKWIYWYKNGNKKMEIVYKEGEEIERREWKEEKTIPKDEESIEYFDIGKIKAKGLYRNGYREGKWIEWYKCGGKKSEGNYIAGKKEGKWIYWYDTGKKKAEVTYKEGEEIERIGDD